jgi:hypothetical protein
MLPFFSAARWRRAAGRSQTGDAASVSAGAALRPNWREEYQGGEELSSIIINGLDTRSNGRGKVKTRTLYKPKHAAPCRTFLL